MSETRFIVIRHGETEWNVEGRWQGHQDSPLTANGLVQAKAVAKRLKDVQFAALYSSRLGRALETAQAISESTGHKINKISGITERRIGVFEGLTRLEIEKNHPDAYQQFQTSDPDFEIPEGESARQHEKRIMVCFNELAIKHPGETIVVVTHGGVLNRVFRTIVGLGLDAPRKFKIMNTSINVLNFVDGEWQLQTWGDINHLDQMESLDEV